MLPTREEAERELVAAWMRAGIANPRENLILAATNADVARLNREAQASRWEAGQLGYRSVRVGEETIHEGDRILFTDTDKRLGLVKSEFATVTRIERLSGRLTVQLDGQEELVRFSLREFDSLRLGYAATVHRAQGMTLEQDAYVLVGGSMQNREMTYVQISRAGRDASVLRRANGGARRERACPDGRPHRGEVLGPRNGAGGASASRRAAPGTGRRTAAFHGVDRAVSAAANSGVGRGTKESRYLAPRREVLAGTRTKASMEACPAGDASRQSLANVRLAEGPWRALLGASQFLDGEIYRPNPRRALWRAPGAAPAAGAGLYLSPRDSRRNRRSEDAEPSVLSVPARCRVRPFGGPHSMPRAGRARGG